MTDTVIRVENLGKKYLIQHQQRERYTALRDVITQRAKALFRNLQSTIHNRKNSGRSKMFPLKSNKAKSSASSDVTVQRESSLRQTI